MCMWKVKASGKHEHVDSEGNCWFLGLLCNVESKWSMCMCVFVSYHPWNVESGACACGMWNVDAYEYAKDARKTLDPHTPVTSQSINQSINQSTDAGQ